MRTASFLVAFSLFSLPFPVEATSIQEFLSPENPRARGIHYQFRTRNTPDGKIARVTALTPGKDFPVNASISVSEVAKTESSFSMESLVSLDPEKEKDRRIAEFLITPELAANGKAAFVLTLTGGPGAAGESIARPWADYFILPLQEFIKADSVVHPPMGKPWKLINQSSSKSAGKMWANFENTKTADALAFQTWRVGPATPLESSPVIQSSIETFSSDGSASISSDTKRYPIEDMVRHQIVEILLGDKTADAIEFTYIYGANPENIESIAHGYIVLFDEVVYAVQHTSKSPISSELAFEIVCKLLDKKFTVGSWSRGDVRPVRIQ